MRSCARLALASLVLGCTAAPDVVATVDGDGGPGADTGSVDAGPLDAGPPDADTPDAGPAPLFEDDFETCDYGRWAGVEAGTTRIDSARTHAGRCSSRAGDRPDDDNALFAEFEPQDEVWVRAWVYFDPATVLPVPGRGAVLFTVGDATWALEVAVIVFLGDDRIGLASFSPLPGADAIEFATAELPAESTGRWRCYELFLGLNRPGASDGRLELYVDGVSRGGTDGSLRGSSALQLSRLIHFQRFHGVGVGTWPADNILQMDDLVVSTARVGCDP